VHTDLGPVEKIDGQIVAQQKAKLSKANFLLGLSPASYKSTTKFDH